MKKTFLDLRRRVGGPMMVDVIDATARKTLTILLATSQLANQSQPSNVTSDENAFPEMCFFWFELVDTRIHHFSVCARHSLLVCVTDDREHYGNYDNNFTDKNRIACK